MKIIAVIIIPACIYILFSCNNAAGTFSVCAASSQEAFDSLKSAVQRKDNNALLNIYDLGVMHLPDTIFTKLQNPTIDIIPARQDGEFGIKTKSGADLYYTSITENGKPVFKKVIIIEKKAGCYQVTSIADVNE